MGIPIAMRIYITGIVQGVGFRPFVKRLALKHNLKGFIRNLGGSEVEIHVEGEKEDIERFVKALQSEKPAVAEIDELYVKEHAVLNYKTFQILKSVVKLSKRSMIPPDFAMCEFCKREILDPSSRFYGYPFHSCAWCGPRFSMIKAIPYDRENTSMVDFPLCKTCLSEYNDINNIRRYHIQGISCPRCGPKIWLTDHKGNTIDTKDPIKLAAKLIDEGSILAIKGIGGFHIASLATSDQAILKLRKRKRRKSKPFAIMALDINIAEKLVVIDDKSKRILESSKSPIVLLPEKEDSGISKLVAPGLRMQGIMLAYTPLHYLLLSKTRDKFLVMTSGNIHEKPMEIDNTSAIQKLGEVVDYFLMHNRRIINRVDDSVVRFTDGKIMLLRRGRGYAPRWIKIPIRLRGDFISFGAELQNAGAVAFDDKVVLTQYIGDTDKYENLEELERYLKFFIKTYDIQIENSTLVADKHPLYASRRLAEYWKEQYGSNIVLVQHHIAHIFSVMAEHKITENVIGIAIDGVGYGDDGKIWGGEIFIVDLENKVIKRAGHLEYVPLPGGDRAVYYPVRSLIGFLTKVMDEESIIKFLRDRSLINGLPYGEKEAEIAIKQTKNAILTSSTGRFLDAISALLNISLYRDYEGEPAIKLESFSYGGNVLSNLNFDIEEKEGKWIVKTTSFVNKVINKIRRLKSKDIAISAQFNLGLALGFIARELAEENGIKKIVVSGGASVNDYIIKGIKRNLSGLNILMNEKVPAGDGGIALGQVYFAGMFND